MKRVISIRKGCGVPGNNVNRLHKCELEIQKYKNIQTSKRIPPVSHQITQKFSTSHFRIQTRTRTSLTRTRVRV